jgi:hypothetical protein
MLTPPRRVAGASSTAKALRAGAACGRSHVVNETCHGCDFEFVMVSTNAGVAS